MTSSVTNSTRKSRKLKYSNRELPNILARSILQALKENRLQAAAMISTKTGLLKLDSTGLLDELYRHHGGYETERLGTATAIVYSRKVCSKRLKLRVGRNRTIYSQLSLITSIKIIDGKIVIAPSYHNDIDQPHEMQTTIMSAADPGLIPQVIDICNDNR